MTGDTSAATAGSPGGPAYDLVVVGAGANGAGIARDAAARGLRVALVEKEDIGSGTSSWSGRLIHGGLRYLEQGDVRLVRESLRERELLFRLAPHLVRPVPLMIPFYRHNRRSALALRAAMVAYDALSFDKSVPRHRILTRAATLRRFPRMDPRNLSGSAIFYDGQVVWSERLCVEVALAARNDGARIYTHARVEGLLREGGRVTGVRVRDALTGDRFAIGARLVVNAAGPWVDDVLAGDGEAAGQRAAARLIGGTKGSHLIVDPFPGAPTDVVYYESQADGRLVLVIPWGRRYLIGTTDRRFAGDPSDARADASEMRYLLDETNRLIPEAGLTEAHVLYTYSGVRPLPYVPDSTEWKVPRSHVIHDHAPERPGLLSIVGGKLTTYRGLAEEVVDDAFRRLGRRAPRCTTAASPLPGARVADWDAFRRDLAATGAAPALVDRLVELYGARASDVLALTQAEPALLEPFDAETGAIGAELAFCWAHEFCRTLTDVLIRRTTVGLNADCGRSAAPRAAEILGDRLGWPPERRAAEVAAYLAYIGRFDVPEAPAPAPAPDATANPIAA